MVNSTTEAELRNLLRKYRVVFDGSRQQAPGLEEVFQKVQDLGRTTEKGYDSNAVAGVSDEPWRRKMLSRARLLAELADQARNENQNERGWRDLIEPLVTARFSIEIVCRRCRAELWSTELEIPLTTSSGPVPALEDRQKRRHNCQCPRDDWGEDRFDYGTSSIFSRRVDDWIELEGEIKEAVKGSKIPDRVIGLRTTKRIERILEFPAGSQGESVAKVIKTCPLKNKSCGLVFPFLILEAKSEKSRDWFSKAALQTGFPIRELLKLQRDLLLERSNMQPLVWFLSNKGEIWRVSGTYVEETKDPASPIYHILDLWTGDITHMDGALSLLLIIDFIIDEARAVYRKEIIRCLLSISENPTPSLIADTDLFSTYGQCVHNELSHNSAPDHSAAFTPVFGVPELLKFFDKENLAVRDARFVHHRLRGLVITTRDLDHGLSALLSSPWSLQGRTGLVDRVRNASNRSDKWCVTADCLYDLEKLWTGKDWELNPPPFPDTNELFLVSFVVESYLANRENKSGQSDQWFERWDQIHELTYVAIAQDALPALEKTLSCRGVQHYYTRHLPVEDCPMVDKTWILDQFGRIRFAPVKQCFAAAIARCKLHSTNDEPTDSRRHSFPAPIPTDQGVVRHFEPSFVRFKDTETLSAGDLLGLLGTTSNGRPSQQFKSCFRTSDHFGELKAAETCDLSISWASTTYRFIQNYNVALLEAVDFNASDITNAHNQRSYCLFVLDRPSWRDAENVKVAMCRDILRTVLRVPDTWAKGKNKKFDNFVDLNQSRVNSMAIASDIVQHTSKQYQLAHSMPELKPPSCANWLFTPSGTKKGIVQVGESYGLDSVLQRIAAAFEAARAKNTREDRHPVLTSRSVESSRKRASNHLHDPKSPASKPQALLNSSPGGEDSARRTSSNVERPTHSTSKPQATPNPPRVAESHNNRASGNLERSKPATPWQLPAPHEVIVLGDSEDEARA